MVGGGGFGGGGDEVADCFDRRGRSVQSVKYLLVLNLLSDEAHHDVLERFKLNCGSKTATTTGTLLICSE